MRVLVCMAFVYACVGTSAACAGAWLWPVNHGQVILTTTFADARKAYDSNGRLVATPSYRRFETQLYLEHGVTDGLTFVGEGAAPFGGLTRSIDAALERAVFSGMPVVKVGRGNAEGMVPITPGVFIAGSNLTANKARLLLMACLMKFGALPLAADPSRPTADERKATQAALARYQDIFNTH